MGLGSLLVPLWSRFRLTFFRFPLPVEFLNLSHELTQSLLERIPVRFLPALRVDPIPAYET